MFISESLVGFPSIIRLSIILTSLVMNTCREHVVIYRRSLEMEDNGLNQNFILCLESKYLLPGFCSKAIYIHIILNNLIWKGILWWFYLMIENIWGEIILCHSDWIKIIGHVVHYPCAIYALIYILQKFPAGYCLCNNLLSNSCAILPKAGRFKLRISLIS